MKNITIIQIKEYAGEFAEDKDIARDVRIHNILPALEQGDIVTLDFDAVNSATQSFIHSLISDLVRLKGPQVLDQVYFKNCNDTIQKLISIVTDYMQEGYGEQ